MFSCLKIWLKLYYHTNVIHKTCDSLSPNLINVFQFGLWPLINVVFFSLKYAKLQIHSTCLCANFCFVYLHNNFFNIIYYQTVTRLCTQTYTNTRLYTNIDIFNILRYQLCWYGLYFFHSCCTSVFVFRNISDATNHCFVCWLFIQ